MNSYRFSHSLTQLFRILGLILIGLLFLTSTVVAHGPNVLKSSTPANGDVLSQTPEKIKAWFYTELDTDETIFRVFNTQGKQVDSGDGGVDLNDPDHASLIVSVPALPDGVYVVQWSTVILNDGDSISGIFRFGVNEEVDKSTNAFVPPKIKTRIVFEDWPWVWIAISWGVFFVAVTGLTIYSKLS